MAQYIMAHDLGTSSDKAALVDFDGNIIATATEDYPTYYPNPAWVEQEAEDYWNASCKASRRIIEERGINPSDVKGVVFSTQAQGIIPVTAEGKLLYRNITWVDGRAEKQAKSIMGKVGGEKIFKMFSGTPIMGKDVLAKVIWLKEERPDIWKETYKILDVNGYMKYKCTGKMVTEISGASAFALDLKKKEWMGVLKLVGMDMEKLPELVCSTDLIGGLLPDAAKLMGFWRALLSLAAAMTCKRRLLAPEWWATAIATSIWELPLGWQWPQKIRRSSSMVRRQYSRPTATCSSLPESLSRREPTSSGFRTSSSREKRKRWAQISGTS